MVTLRALAHEAPTQIAWLSGFLKNIAESFVSTKGGNYTDLVIIVNIFFAITAVLFEEPLHQR